jgi:hypothetical protein
VVGDLSMEEAPTPDLKVVLADEKWATWLCQNLLKKYKVKVDSAVLQALCAWRSNEEIFYIGSVGLWTLPCLGSTQNQQFS